MSGKLVRDLIPERMIADGVTPVTRRIDGSAEHLTALRAKLDEEVMEYDRASGYDRIIDELADILEVIYALAEVRGIAPDRLDSYRWQKAEERGRFRLGIWLDGPGT